MSLLKWLFGKKEHISEDAIKHSNEGEFNTVGRLVSGGHGQKNIEKLLEYNQEFNILKTYSNGVRVGNVPKHKKNRKQKGTNQSWFPKWWNAKTIKRAGQVVARGKRKEDGLIKTGYYFKVFIGIIRKRGKIATIFPMNVQKNKRGVELDECKKTERIDKGICKRRSSK